MIRRVRRFRTSSARLYELGTVFTDLGRDPYVVVERSRIPSDPIMYNYALERITADEAVIWEVMAS